VDTARIPGVDAVGAAERCVADERVTAAVVVFGLVVGAVVVLLLWVSSHSRFRMDIAAAYLCPVQLVVREARLVESAEQAQDMRVEVELSEILAVFVDRAGLVPALSNSRVVLPGVE